VSMNQDAEHLRLLSIFHYVFAGIIAFFSCIPMIYVVVGIFMFAFSFSKNAQPPPAFIGIFFIIFGGLFVLFGWTLSILIFLAGKNLQRHRHYTFCLVIAAIMCLSMPFGTILGVFTIVALNRPAVRELFQSKEIFA
jgi:hypothetical protein